MKVRAILIELVALLLGSALAGFVIGVLQHYVSFGFNGYNFGREAFGLALFEGGIMGLMFALPTGLFTYYIVLERRVTPKQVAIIVLGSLVGGSALGIVMSWLSSFVTPLLTIGLAVGVKLYQLSTSTKPYLVE
jgi:hypothetical protein